LVPLIRWRKDILCLDYALELTRGNPVGISAALAQLHPARGSYTGVATAEDDGPNLIGQIIYTAGNPSARLSFVAPGTAAVSPLLTGLLEGLVWQAGDWGAFHLVGEIDELSPAFEALRKSGFTVYAWQRIWKLQPLPSADGKEAQSWQPVSSVDEFAIRNLYQNLVPPLVQSAEPLPSQRLRGLVYWQNGEIMAYVNWVEGPRGLFLHPIIHPDLTNYGDPLRALVHNLPRMGRPVYLAVRSYQSWLENALTDLPAEATPRHALLVKHLATLLRVPLNARLGVDTRSSEVPTASMVQQNINYPE
jgi:hypothetical protein